MTQKHTPAPWNALIDYDRKYFQIETDMDAICTNGSCYEPFNPANAHLLAAAPELLEALEDCKLALHSYLSDTIGLSAATNRVKKYDAAIAKARGES